MTTNEGRCEPPPGTAPWTHHWIGPADGDVEPWLWVENGGWCRGAQYFDPKEMRERGWVYDSPCAPPATVAALVEALEAIAGPDAPFDANPEAFGTYAARRMREQATAALAAYREAGR